VERSGCIALVPPRYGEGVVGGAEAVIAETAHGLADRGWAVEVLTTCARDHFTWANEFPAGESTDGSVTVRRFPAVVDTPRADRARIHAAILAGERPSITDQQVWMNDDLRVPELFHFLLDRAGDYRAIVFAPYLFWPTFACGQIAPERTILMPCLHDEPEARLDIFQPLFNSARGLWFLSDPEADLAERIFSLPPRRRVVGSGVRAPAGYDAVGFRTRHGLDRPFVFYAGRREGAKGWEWMLEAFAAAVARYDLPLAMVTCGTGEVHPPAAIADRVIDLGFVSDRERNDAMAAAVAYVQPSALESFSRTIMEAWLAGTLVLANEASDVVRWHCERSGAGLLWRNPDELAEALSFVAASPDAAREVACRGRSYVLEHYDPDKVLDRIEATLWDWT